jgi:hypothetical protein
MTKDPKILCESYSCSRKRHENTNYKSVATRFFIDKSRPTAYAYCQDCYNTLGNGYSISYKREDAFEELTREEYLVHKIMNV